MTQIRVEIQTRGNDTDMGGGNTDEDNTGGWDVGDGEVGDPPETAPVEDEGTGAPEDDDLIIGEE